MKVPTRPLACLFALFTCLSVYSQSNPLRITFQNLLKPAGRALAPTVESLKVNGKRVRMEGYMALMDDPPKGGFWLCPSPVFQDESGAGTGDLPPNAVFVIVRGSQKQPIAHLKGKLSVSGVFRLGDKSRPFTITLDADKEVSVPNSKGSSQS